MKQLHSGAGRTPCHHQHRRDKSFWGCFCCYWWFLSVKPTDCSPQILPTCWHICEKITLDQVYSNVSGTQKAVLCPRLWTVRPHLVPHLVPVPSLLTETKTDKPDYKTNESLDYRNWDHAVLFVLTDWDLFRNVASLEGFSTSGQILSQWLSLSAHVDNIVPTIKTRKFSNQMPWLNRQVSYRKCHAFGSVKETKYKMAQNRLKKARRTAKRQNREGLNGCSSAADTK